MPLSQLFLAVFFYIIFTLFAAVGLPFTSRIFSNRTLAFVASKPLGLVLFGYVIWLLGSFKILNYQSYWAILSLFILALAGGIYASQNFFRDASLPEVAG